MKQMCVNGNYEEQEEEIDEALKTLWQRWSDYGDVEDRGTKSEQIESFIYDIKNAISELTDEFGNLKEVDENVQKM